MLRLFSPSVLLCCLFAALAANSSLAADKAQDKAKGKQDGWVEMFDGKSFDGWKAAENPDSFTIDDGRIVAHGPRAHLFYVGNDKPLVNFEFEAEVMTTPGSNSGIFFHTQYQEDGWPKIGYECQVNNTYVRDPQKTGGLYNTVRVTEPPAKDDVWYTQAIRVEGKHVTVKINGKTVVDFMEPEAKEGTVKLSSGTFALQAHDPKSKVYYRNLKYRPLP